MSRFAARARRAARLSGYINVLIAHNSELRELNRQFRHKDKPTDVLSFPSEEDRFAGDIAISADIARENGKQLGHGITTELKVLILHGVLHLAGYDHETDNGEMARKERRLRAELNLPDGLIERASASVKPAARKRTPPPAKKQSLAKSSRLATSGKAAGRNSR
ncbi:MAG TPA: rRNA maturation RNase YbeY [Clostridia bacterium]|nr:rRNA maturation RNase YbeY [Clostridia bacterium]